MAKEFAKGFYNSTTWIKCREGYIKSVFGLCEKCGKKGHIVHHIVPITVENITNPDITLNWKNLMYLCTSCHNIIHGKKVHKRRAVFDKQGNIINFI